MQKNYLPVKRGFYSFDKIRAGDFLIFLEEFKDYYQFLYIPGPEPFYLTVEDFNNAVKTGVLTFVEQLPEEIFEETVNFSLSSMKKVEYTPSR